VTLADVLREADHLFEGGQPEVEISSTSADARFRLLDRPGPVGADAESYDPNSGRWRSCSPSGAWFRAADVLADDWDVVPPEGAR
jgi:hypothetical protein